MSRVEDRGRADPERLAEAGIAVATVVRSDDLIAYQASVYFAGPIDYIEHRTHGAHLQDNWRHRFFGEVPIRLLCPTCMNEGKTDIVEIMQTNKDAIRRATFFVGYFPGDVATFGTPIEVWDWVHNHRESAVLIHPSRPGAFVQYLALQYDLIVVRTFEEARQWLMRRL